MVLEPVWTGDRISDASHIKREFASYTVSFVYGLRYIERFDHIASMKQGEIVEWEVRITM
ncbi:ABC transporter [Penicillium fimorum]|uniref:ABC transporter n=1 Tax=Penicillium fimorum TaxID=1882269 RepID=A0A9X0CD69_9EURO|nr:ABC transporter [Penicillium fimorum]